MLLIKDRKPIVCLDAGHNNYGADTGSQGCGLLEQNLTLDIVLRTEKLLIPRGFTVVLTRTGDYVNGAHASMYESLLSRCNIANNAKADLFVSVHINATPGGTGTEVLIQGAGGQANDMANRALAYLIKACGWRNRGVKVQNVMVLRETNMPAILTENGFIDNPGDAAKLADPNFRQRIAEAHAMAICEFFNIKYDIAPTPKIEGGIDYAILIYTQDDLETAKRLFGKYGLCPIFFRDTINKNLFSQDVYEAKQLIIVGGGSVKHPNEVLLSGKSWFNTNVAVRDYTQ